jgi:hypothetical protein
MSATPRLVRLLGLTSIGFGVFDYLRSDRLAANVGMADGRIFRLAGAREIVSGVAIALFPRHPAPLVSRLIGDAADIAVLSAVAARPGNERRIAAIIGAGIVLAVSTIDAIALSAQRQAA